MFNKKLFKSKLTFVAFMIIVSMLLKAESCGGKKTTTTTLKLSGWTYMTLEGVTQSGQPVTGQPVSMFGVSATMTNGSASVEYSGTSTEDMVVVGGPEDNNGGIIKKTINNVPKGQLEAGLTKNNVMPAGVLPLDYFSPMVFREQTWNLNLENRELWIYFGGVYGLPDIKDDNGNPVTYEKFIQDKTYALTGKRFKEVKVVERHYTVDEIEALATQENPVYVTYLYSAGENFTSRKYDSERNITAVYTSFGFSPNQPEDVRLWYQNGELIGRMAIGLGSPPESYVDDYPSVMYPKPEHRSPNFTIHDRRAIQILLQLEVGTSAPDVSYYE